MQHSIVCVHGGHCQWSLQTVSIVTVTFLLTPVAPFVATVIFRQNVPNPLFIDVLHTVLKSLFCNIKYVKCLFGLEPKPLTKFSCSTQFDLLDKLDMDKITKIYLSKWQC